MFYVIFQRIGSVKILKKLNEIFSRKEVRKNKGIEKLKKNTRQTKHNVKNEESFSEEAYFKPSKTILIT